jgi:hypothetical protein
LLHKGHDDGLGLRADLETKRCASRVVVIDGFAIDSECTLTLLAAEDESGLEYAWKNQHTLGTREKSVGAFDLGPEPFEGSVHFYFEFLCRRRQCLLWLNADKQRYQSNSHSPENMQLGSFQENSYLFRLVP